MPDEERQTLILVEERKTLNSTRPSACFSSLSGPCSTRCRPRLWYVEHLYLSQSLLALLASALGYLRNFVCVSAVAL
jgi:hypothetical protein